MAWLWLVSAPQLPPAARGYSWSKVFDDEFNGSRLEQKNWTTCYDWYSYRYNGCTNDGNHELEWYIPQQVSVGGGRLTLAAQRQDTVGLAAGYQRTFPYRSGMVTTGGPQWNSNQRRTFLYGYFVARLKATSGNGIWPAFWLLPPAGQWPPEIDIMEITGDRHNRVLMTYHWGKLPDPQKDSSNYDLLTETNGWHTYAVNWRPGRIDWYIDGFKRKSVQSSNVPTQPMEIIANLAVGGDLPGPPDAKTLLPGRLQVDYIRVYQQVK